MPVKPDKFFQRNFFFCRYLARLAMFFFGVKVTFYYNGIIKEGLVNHFIFEEGK